MKERLHHDNDARLKYSISGPLSGAGPIKAGGANCRPICAGS